MKADLHLHSKYSDRPSEWILRRLGSPESFVEPLDAYRYCRERGMDFVTLTDHNTIEGALRIAHLPNTFVSVEITTYFPEDGCKIHCLAHGIDEKQFGEIQSCRENIYDLQRYLCGAGISHTIAHPLFRINDRLTLDHVERLLLLFPRFERINGARHAQAASLIESICMNLTPQAILDMADRQGLEPQGKEPWRKIFIGGSDDHCGVYAAVAYTETPPAYTTAEFLGHLRSGRCKPGGSSGTSLRLAHSLYHIAYAYYAARFSGNGGGNPIISELFKRVTDSAPKKEDFEEPGWFRKLGQRLVRRYRLNRLSPVERELLEHISPLLQSCKTRKEGDSKRLLSLAKASHYDNDQGTFEIAAKVGQQLTAVFVRQSLNHLSEGRLIDSLQAVAALGPVALSLAPYVAAFGSQHRDDAFLRSLAERYPCAQQGHEGVASRRAWFTDTLNDVNGVAFSIRTIARLLNEKGLPVQVICSLENPPSMDGVQVVNFPPIDQFPIPEYEELNVAFPPFLEIIEYIEREKIDEIMISTPGTMGLVALAAAELLGIPAVGFYHTDIPRYVRCLTGDHTLEPLAWKAMLWFYGRMSKIYVPSRNYLELLAENGFEREKMRVLPRGVDVQRFNPEKRDPNFAIKYGLNGKMKFLYVGRISREKNIEVLIQAFHKMGDSGESPCELMLVGDGPERRNLEKQFAAQDLVFTGPLYGDELARAYASADAFVFPSATDTFGNVVLEAQASGLPVIVSDQGGPREIIAGRQSGLVVPAGCPDELSKAMQRLVDDLGLRDELKERALETAGDFSWDAALSEFL